MAVTDDPVLDAIDQAEGQGVDPTQPFALGPHEIAPPAEEPDPAAPPTDGELTAGGAVGMAGVDAGAPDFEVEEGEEAPEEEPETVASDGSREGEAPDRPSEDSPSLSLDEAYEKMFGAKPDTDQAAFILGLVQELQTAPPERAAQARAILSGMVDQAPAPAAEPEPIPEFTPPPIPEDFDDETRQALAQRDEMMRRMWQELQQTRQASTQAQQNQVAAQMEAQRQQAAAAVVAARERFVADHPGLSPADVAALQAHAERNQMYGYFLAQHGATPEGFERAAYDTFRHTLVDHPEIQKSVIAAQTAAEAEKRRKDQTRKQKATAVSGASTAPPKKQPQTKAERDAALLDAIRNGALG